MITNLATSVIVGQKRLTASAFLTLENFYIIISSHDVVIM